ncbi:MAG TPA: deoxyribonuclease V [Candidatus Xenobia bacterium]|nr:deoxyribonuclease V [Candidatus Xenobia bacterium]
MQVKLPHRWDLSPKEAAQLQLELRDHLNPRRDFRTIRTVAGADIAVDGRAGYAGVIAYRFPDLQEIERQSARLPLAFPYVPGLLAFREGPALLEAFARLRTEPDLLLFDAHGYSHPRRFGLACHLSVVLDKPGIGVAKSLLVGKYQEPADKVGAWSPLVDSGETVGAVLRTRRGVRPIFISIGHRVDLKAAIELALACCDGYRIPKPTREADHFVARLKRGEA